MNLASAINSSNDLMQSHAGDILNVPVTSGLTLLAVSAFFEVLFFILIFVFSL
jgi:hypothetical protein